MATSTTHTTAATVPTSATSASSSASTPVAPTITKYSGWWFSVSGPSLSHAFKDNPSKPSVRLKRFSPQLTAPNGVAKSYGAWLGEEVHVYVKEPIETELTAYFEVYSPESGCSTIKSWTETLTPISLNQASNRVCHNPPPGFKTRFDWRVNIDGDDSSDLLHHFEVSIILNGSNPSGGFCDVHLMNKFYIFGYKEPIVCDFQPNANRMDVLPEIMTNEYYRVESGRYVFDQTELEQYLNTLSTEQKRLLSSYIVDEYQGNRLVTFITISSAKPHKKMHADFFGAMENPPYAVTLSKGVYSNATFATFHCRGLGTRPQLVYLTEHFWVAFRNKYTRYQIQNGNQWTDNYCQSSVDCDDWAAKSNPHPPRYLMGVAVKKGGASATLWYKIYDSQGRNILADANGIHGTVNTKGCWLFLKNYNWPRIPVPDVIPGDGFPPSLPYPPGHPLAAGLGLKISDQLEAIAIYHKWRAKDLAPDEYMSAPDGSDPTTVERHDRNIERHLNANGYTLMYSPPSPHPTFPSPPWQSSWNKAFVIDKNYSYILLARYLMGVPFFSTRWKSSKHEYANMFIHHSPSNYFTLNENRIGQFFSVRWGDLDPASGDRCAFYDIEKKHTAFTGSSDDPTTWDSTYWRPSIRNSLGFRPIRKFTKLGSSDIQHCTHCPESDLIDATCSDIYFFKEDGFSLRNKNPNEDLYDFSYVMPPGLSYKPPTP